MAPSASSFRSISFITCVADAPEYAACRASIAALDPCGLALEVLPVDNAGNPRSAPEALNLGWSRAAGDLLVFCHEDVVFPREWVGKLLEGIAALEGLEPPWAVAGPMGRAGKRYFGHASGPDGAAAYHGPLPARVETLDELCLVVARALPLRFDERLGGFHLYGADLCIQAVEAGLAPYAIDAPCRHDSATRHRPPEYHAVKRRLQRKWMFRRRKVGRSVGTTCGRIRFGILEGWI
ncbi:MAG: hypothetical protein HY721_29010 [Planctomycetes bacterium]|nr:hypothetical protein [Planctomycetota bacterium]